MFSFNKYLFLISILLFIGCKTTKSIKTNTVQKLKNNTLSGNFTTLYEGINDTTFVKLINFSNDFVLDMKYATQNNFLKQKVYACEECYLRLKTIKYLIAANTEFQKKGYRIKLFDCYRPLDVQKKMWELVPNADYVADPKNGSIHNRGGAVDISIVNSKGKELDMGTSFDFFGPEASHKYQGLSSKIKKNRIYLKEVMLRNNFKSYDSEWWHYNLSESTKDKLANFQWNCN